MNAAYHIPVLLAPSIDALVTNPDGTYVDVTFGGGGHSAAILQKLSPKGKLIAFDRDKNALNNAIQDKRFTLVNHNFKFTARFLQYLNVLPVHGILADLGISSHQIDDSQRGFAHRFDGPLDMRMDADLKVSAHHLVNTYPEDKLAEILKAYGELPNARKVASLLVRERGRKQIDTTADLKQALADLTPKQSPAKFLSMVFQALRIYVNQELGALEQLLLDADKLIETNGRLVVISYHSLEDRMVKHYLQTGNLNGTTETDMFGNILRPFKPLFSKPIISDEAENAQNPRARSAKLRIGVKQVWNQTKN